VIIRNIPLVGGERGELGGQQNGEGDETHDHELSVELLH
jgi:hypothetical protein